MLYDKHEAARLQRRLLWISGAAIIIAFLPAWAGAGPVGAICGSGIIPGSTGGWIQSVAGGWTWMIVAMMGALLVEPLMHIRVSSFDDRIWRSISLFLFAYVAAWLAAGLVISFVLLVEKRFAANASIVVVVNLLVAVAWQASPLKQTCLNRGHAHPPLSAFGRRADWDALRFGAAHGLWCIGSCWALMLTAASFERWHFAVMAIVGILMYCERLDPPAPARWQIRGLRTARLVLRQAMRPSRA